VALSVNLVKERQSNTVDKGLLVGGHEGAEGRQRIANLRDEAIAALTTWRTNVESGDFPTAAQGIAGDATLIAALNELPR